MFASYFSKIVYQVFSQTGATSCPDKDPIAYRILCGYGRYDFSYENIDFTSADNANCIAKTV